VNCSYTSTAGNAISSSEAAIVFATKDYDTNGTMNTSTGVYTVPVAGKYRVSTLITLAATTLSTSQQVFIDLYKNGSFFKNLNTSLGNGTNNNYRTSGTATVQCNAGDTIQVNGASSVSTTLLTSAGYNYICIERIGS
jgi:hypothetical protein